MKMKESKDLWVDFDPLDWMYVMKDGSRIITNAPYPLEGVLYKVYIGNGTPKEIKREEMK